MNMVRAGFFPAGVALALAYSMPVRAEEVGCVTTAWKMLGANHRVCVEAFDDPKVPGVACHLSQARTGGVSGSLGLAEDPSRFSIACRQVGPITLPEKLKENEEVFTADTSILFKETRVVACSTASVTPWSISATAPRWSKARP